MDYAEQVKTADLVGSFTYREYLKLKRKPPAARKSQNGSALPFSSLREAIKIEPKKIEMFGEIIESAKDDGFDRDAWVEKLRREDEYRMAGKANRSQSQLQIHLQGTR